jgi:hypothetical protein
MAEKTVNEATLRLMRSLREANRAVAESVVAVQERNGKFAQSMLANGMEILKNQVEGTQALVREIEQQARKQQEAYQIFLQELGQEGGSDLEQQVQKQQETFQKLMRDLEQQAQKQQEVFQKLMEASTEVSKNLLYIPLSYFQQFLDATETISSL